MKLAVYLLAAFGLACTAESVGDASSNIINGRRSVSDNENWTVAVVLSGLPCSGTVIGPYHVLTAKHCVYDESRPLEPNEIAIADGLDINFGDVTTHSVHEWVSTSGAYTPSDLGSGRDIAVIIVNEPFVGITPRTLGRTVPANGSDATIVGFGRSTESNLVSSAGTKFVGDTRIIDSPGRLIQAGGDSWICFGDSGGPLLVGSDVVGVTSFLQGDCSVDGSFFFVAVAAHLELIEEALAILPPCEPSEELCDEVDNNCDGVVDEGCNMLGEACVTAMDCLDRLCESVDATNVCVRSCDPASGAPACPEEFHCAETGCGTGHCVRGAAGSRADGEECSDESQCVSRRCAMVGETMRCARQCESAAGDCGEGLVCDGSSGCDECLLLDDSSLPRLLGVSCTMDEQCMSGDCTEDEGTANGFCTASCGEADPCPSDFRCREARCIAVDPRELGEDCEVHEECASGECVDVDGALTCVGPCAGCAGGFECVATSAGERCVRDGLPLGADCTAATECRSGSCIGGLCSRDCDDVRCPASFECHVAEDASLCLPLPASGGCGCGVVQETPWSSGGFLVAMLMLVWRRNRFPL